MLSNLLKLLVTDDFGFFSDLPDELLCLIGDFLLVPWKIKLRIARYRADIAPFWPIRMSTYTFSGASCDTWCIFRRDVNYYLEETGQSSESIRIVNFAEKNVFTNLIITSYRIFPQFKEQELVINETDSMRTIYIQDCSIPMNDFYYRQRFFDNKYWLWGVEGSFEEVYRRRYVIFRVDLK